METSLTFMTIKPMPSTQSVGYNFICNGVAFYISTATFRTLEYGHDISASGLIFKGNEFIVRGMNSTAHLTGYGNTVFQDNIIIIKLLESVKVNTGNSTGVTITT